MKKINILALHLGYGGIEKCVVDLANILIDKYDVEILVTYKLYDDVVYTLDNRVKVRYLTDVKPNKLEFIKYLKKFRIIKAFKEGLYSLKVLHLRKSTMINAIRESRADAIISTRILFNNYLGKNFNGLKIGWEHNHHHNNKKYIKKFVSSCKKLDKVVLVSDNLRNYYNKEFNKYNIKCECIFIPNFINYYPDKVSNLDNNNIISVGRLSKEKGYVDLIDVFKLVNLKMNARLDIIGDGKEREAIEKKIIKNNLSTKIKLHGYQKSQYINNMYQKSSLYVMTSYTESFGLVLVEAMSFGLPCIAYTSAEGACDIIQNNYNGYLIKNRNEHDMADTIVKLLNDKKKLKELSKNARISASKYLEDNVKKKWINIIGG